MVRVAWGGNRSGIARQPSESLNSLELNRSKAVIVRPGQARRVWSLPISDLPAELLCPVLPLFVKL